MIESKIKETMGHVNIRQEMKEEILQNVLERKRQAEGGEIPKSRRKALERKKRLGRARRIAQAAAALGIVLAVGIPVQAGIRHLLKERLEAMPQEGREELADMTGSQEVGADSYSRAYSAEEAARLPELLKEYQEGRFPAGELKSVSTKEEAEGEELCYVEEGSYFQLPDRKLTDEELLEVIDFTYKRDYAVTEQAKETLAGLDRQREEREEALQAQIQAEEGISMEEAVRQASGLLEKLFGADETGRERNGYVDEMDGEAVYVVTYSVRSTEYHYFWINAADGRVKKIDYSTPDMIKGEWMSEEEALSQKESCLEAAEGCLEELGIADEFSAVEGMYVCEDGQIAYNRLSFYFIRDDGEGCRVQVSCRDGSLMGFEEVDSQDITGARTVGTAFAVR